MSKVLVYSEVHGDTVKSVALEILGKLAGQEVDVAVIGDLPEAGVKALAERVPPISIKSLVTD